MPKSSQVQKKENSREIRPSLQLVEDISHRADEQGCRKLVTVTADEEGRLYAEGEKTYGLAVATSCLLQPITGDRVSAIVDGAQLIITDILSRQQTNAVMTLNSQQSSLRIMAPEIELHGERKLMLHSPSFMLLTRSSQWFADTLHQISRHLFVRSEHASRKVEQTDETRAKHIVQDAQQSLVMTSEIGSLKSSAVLKIDGGQVHVG